MKIIYIPGDDDFDAMRFERNVYADIDTWNSIKKEGHLLLFDEDGDEFIVEAQALEFEDVDPKFIRFIREEIQDYDIAKTQNFYVVDEDTLVARTRHTLSDGSYSTNKGPGVSFVKDEPKHGTGS